MTSYEKLKQLLNRGRSLTLDQAAEEIGVSRRQVRRLLKQMRADGLVIQEEQRNGLKHFTLAPESVEITTEVDLTEKELHALTVAGLAAQSVLQRTPIADDLSSAMRTLLASAGTPYSFEPETVNEHWHFDSSRKSNVDATIFLAVVQATTSQRTLDIDYYSASKQELQKNLRIDPLVIAEQGETWMVAAYVHGLGKVRDFALADVRRAEETGAAFSWPKSFDAEAHFESRFTALKGRGDGYAVRVEVRSDKAAYFRRKSYHPSQTIETKREDGSIVVSFHTSSLDDIAAFIRSWGPVLRVLSPASLVRRIRTEAEEVARRYAPPEEHDS